MSIPVRLVNRDYSFLKNNVTPLVLLEPHITLNKTFAKLVILCAKNVIVLLLIFAQNVNLNSSIFSNTTNSHVSLYVHLEQ